MEKPSYKLELFEGPLDLLLSLIQRNKLDIYDIPINLILAQYLEYIAQMREHDMSMTADFVEYTSTLLYIKSKMLLPRSEDEEEEDPRAGLVAALLEYQRARQVAAYLEELYTSGGVRFTRDTAQIEADMTLDDNSYQVQVLCNAFESLFKKNRKKLPPPASTFKKITSQVKATVFEKAISIMRRLQRKEELPLADVFAYCVRRDDIIASFLALLELIKTSRITVIQDDEQNCTVRMNPIDKARVRRRLNYNQPNSGVVNNE